MKEEKTFYYCEYCNKAIEKQSPPSTDQYVQGLIQIRDGSILLNNLKKEKSHAETITGYYCNKDCLHQRLADIRKK